jgi:hypothetical protein
LKKQLTTSIEIHGTPRQVWRSLTDFKSYPSWNPFILDARGACAVGSSLRLRMQSVGGRPTTFTPTVREVVVEQRLRWVGTFVWRRLLKADHTFTIEPLASGCRLMQSETFSGALVPLLGRSLDTGTLPAFIAMNEALKLRVEGPVVPPVE